MEEEIETHRPQAGVQVLAYVSIGRLRLQHGLTLVHILDFREGKVRGLVPFGQLRIAAHDRIQHAPVLGIVPGHEADLPQGCPGIAIIGRDFLIRAQDIMALGAQGVVDGRQISLEIASHGAGTEQGQFRIGSIGSFRRSGGRHDDGVQVEGLVADQRGEVLLDAGDLFPVPFHRAVHFGFPGREGNVAGRIGFHAPFHDLGEELLPVIHQCRE